MSDAEERGYDEAYQRALVKNAGLPPWAPRLVAAMAAFERAKAARDEAIDACVAAEEHVSECEIEKRKWLELVMNQSWGMQR